MNRSSVSIIVVWLIFVGVCISVVTRSSFSTDLEAFLPEAPTPAQQLLVDQLRDGIVSRLLLVAVEGDNEERLSAISHVMSRELSADAAFVGVNNGSQELLATDAAFLIKHRYLLSPAVQEGRFSAARLRLALEGQLEMLASTMGALSGRFLGSDPTGEFFSIVEQLESRNRPQTRHGVWFDASGARALLVAQTVAPGFDIDAQQNAVARIEAAFENAAAESGSATASLITVGPGVFAVQIRDAIKADAIRVTSVASLVIAGLLLLVLRSLRSLGLIALPVVTGALAGIAAVAVVFGEIHGITVGFGATLIGESVDYAIHLLTGTVRGQRPQQALSRIWPVLRLGVLTSIAGSAALLFSGFPGLAQLGLFSIAGLLTALVVTRWIVPLLMPVGFSVDLATRYGPNLTRLIDGASVARVPAVLLVVGCALWLALRGGAPWNDNFESLNPVSPAAKALDRELRAELGAPDVRKVIVVHGVDQEATLQIAEAVGRTLDTLVNEQALAGYESPALYLPSKVMQRARQGAIPERAQLRENLALAAAGLPFKRGLFEDFVKQAERARTSELLDREDFGSTRLAARIDSLLVRHRNGWHAMMPLLDVVQQEEILSALERFDPRQVMLVDLKSEADALYQGYRVQILTFSIIGAITIVVVLLAALRSVRRCVSVVLPIAGALVVTVAILMAAGVELTMFHLVAMLLVAGVGSNYTLFFDRAMPGVIDSGRTYVSLLVCNLSTVFGFGLIALASTPVLKAIGTTVSIGAALSLLLGAVFMNRDRSPKG